MKLSVYIKKYLLSDIILLLIIAGTSYAVVDIWHDSKAEQAKNVELVPLNIHPDDEIG